MGVEDYFFVILLQLISFDITLPSFIVYWMAVTYISIFQSMFSNQSKFIWIYHYTVCFTKNKYCVLYSYCFRSYFGSSFTFKTLSSYFSSSVFRKFEPFQQSLLFVGSFTVDLLVSRSTGFILVYKYLPCLDLSVIVSEQHDLQQIILIDDFKS